MTWRNLVQRSLRLVLAWFVLSIGCAIASPIVAPQSMALLCTANGISLVKVGGFGEAQESGQAGSPTAASTIDCPLCWTPLAGVPQQRQLAAPLFVPTRYSGEAPTVACVSPRYSLPVRAPPVV